jgi:hypothetical protein
VGPESFLICLVKYSVGESILKLNLKVTVVLAALLLAVSIVPSFAVTYSPGVTTGQWVKYGNIVGIGPGLESVNTTDWMKIEAISVSGKEVKLRTSGMFKNGTSTPESNATYNVETGTVDGAPSVYGPVIAGNLNAGDALPPTSSNVQVNKTETRTYVGVSRSVNMLNISLSATGYTATLIVVWDKTSGMMLEMETSTIMDAPTQQTVKLSLNAVDTNIFGASAGSTGSWLMDNIIYIATGIVVVVIAVALVFAFQRRRPVATQVAATAAPPAT